MSAVLPKDYHWPFTST